MEEGRLPRRCPAGDQDIEPPAHSLAQGGRDIAGIDKLAHPIDRGGLPISCLANVAERISGHIIVERQVGGHMLADRDGNGPTRSRWNDDMDTTPVGKAFRNTGVLAAGALMTGRPSEKR